MCRDLAVAACSLSPILRQLVAENLVDVELVPTAAATRGTRYRLSALGAQAAADSLRLIERHELAA
jgi:hypothetical protein